MIDAVQTAKDLAANQELLQGYIFLSESGKLGESHAKITAITATDDALSIDATDSQVWDGGDWKPDLLIVTYAVALNHQTLIVDEHAGITRVSNPYFGTMFIFPDKETHQKFLARKLLL